jgi:hypothetical protein
LKLTNLSYNKNYSFVGVWLSLVERVVWDHEVVGSNPTTPTIFHSIPAGPMSKDTLSLGGFLFIATVAQVVER